MFNKSKLHIISLAVLAIAMGSGNCLADQVMVNPVKANSLPINAAANSGKVQQPSTIAPNTLVSPSKPQSVETAKANTVEKNANPTTKAPQKKAALEEKKDDFDFELKMKAKNASAKENSEVSSAEQQADNLPKDIQYKSSPVEHLGNSVLSQIDDDLFTQMSEIEKSMTLLTLELKREKIRNEIEAQKAIRQKNADDLERQKNELKMQEYEKKKKIEAEVLAAKQNLLDREQIIEVLRQRKLLNAYMNQMLMNQQDWLKEKEALYQHIAMLEQEKKDLVKSFKQRIDKVLEASAKNIQIAEAAKANFERVVKNLKARNEQLRKRVEADAKIIKNTKNMYIQSQSIEELKDKNAAILGTTETNTGTTVVINSVNTADANTAVEEVAPEKLNTKYALLGITGRAGSMSIEVIGTDGQPVSLKIGSILPTGHVVKEIGSDYAKFSKDGEDDYLYIGRSIEGYTPVVEESGKGTKSKKK
ncbi:MAG: hypothetical protein IKW39_02505 [Alphaproteobacteria bacterium]|nr:hypothetical protein [Alphaproteobacteria bacterium]